MSPRRRSAARTAPSAAPPPLGPTPAAIVAPDARAGLVDGAGRLPAILAALGGRWPVVTGPGWAMVHGDCLDVMAEMPDKCVQVAIGDPPYEVEAHTDGRRQKVYEGRGVFGIEESPLPFAAITATDRDAAAIQVARVVENRAAMFCQAEAVGAWRDAFNAADFPYRRAIPWCKPDAMPSLHGRYPGQAYESIVLAQYPSAPACPLGGKSRIYTFMRCNNGRTDNPHPTTKPIALMDQMVADFTDPGDLVLDPFAGSATTGVACLRLGRSFLGIERDPAYFEIACRRLQGGEAKPRESQPGLFDRPEAAP